MAVVGFVPVFRVEFWSQSIYLAVEHPSGGSLQMLNSIIDKLGLGSETQPPTAGPSLEMDSVLEVLSAARRREVIKYLCTQETETTVRTLSEHLAEIEDTDRKRTYIALYQHHLSSLQEHGLLIWNQQRGTVKATPLCEEVYRAQLELQRHID